LRVQLGEDLLLDVGALADGLDDQINLSDGGEIRGGAQTLARGFGDLRCQDALLGELGERLLDCRDALGESRRVDIHQQHRGLAHGEDLSDAVAHRARADDGDLGESALAHV